jgi:hypothetical protein
MKRTRVRKRKCQKREMIQQQESSHVRGSGRAGCKGVSFLDELLELVQRFLSVWSQLVLSMPSVLIVNPGAKRSIFVVWHETMAGLFVELVPVAFPRCIRTPDKLDFVQKHLLVWSQFVVSIIFPLLNGNPTLLETCLARCGASSSQRKKASGGDLHASF